MFSPPVLASQMEGQEMTSRTRTMTAMLLLALGVTAFVTLAIGLFPNPMISVVNGVLGLTQVTPIANLVR